MSVFYSIYFITERVSVGGLTAILGSITVLLGLLLPLIISFYLNRQNLHQEQRKILYKVPLDATVVALILGIITEVAFIIFPGHGDGAELMSVIWPAIIGPIYLLIILVVSFLVSLIVYKIYKNKAVSTQNLLANNSVSEQQIGRAVQNTGTKKIIWSVLGFFVLGYLTFFLYHERGSFYNLINLILFG